MIELKDVVDNAVFYSSKPSMESENYIYGTTEPLKPRRLKVKWQQNPGGMCIYAHSFDKETGEIDYDSNATAIVELKDLFYTKLDADLAYIESYKEYIKILQRDLYIAMDNLDEFMNEMHQDE